MSRKELIEEVAQVEEIQTLFHIIEGVNCSRPLSDATFRSGLVNLGGIDPAQNVLSESLYGLA